MLGGAVDRVGLVVGGGARGEGGGGGGGLGGVGGVSVTPVCVSPSFGGPRRD